MSSVIAAYAIVVIVVFLYWLVLWGRERALEREIRDLRSRKTG